MRFITILFVLLSLTVISGCSTGAPDSFMRMTKQYWEVVDLKPTIRYDDAWQRMIYIITKKFELEMISKEDGYVRSAFGPSYFTEDMQNDKYQVRIVAKFTPDKKRMEFKIESRIWDGKIFQNGSDVRVAANMRLDFLYSLGEPPKRSSMQSASPDSLEQSETTEPE